MQSLSRFLREPLVHFVIIGVLIFALFKGLAEPGPEVDPGNTILVEPERVEQLVASFQAVWLRAPNEAEKRSLIDDYVREEIYYREALALGLDRNDAMVRRRLRQKMEFLTDSGADVLEPAEGELETHLQANTEIFGRPALLAFEQIYLGESPEPQAVARSLQTLRSNPPVAFATLGERSLLPPTMSLSSGEAIDATFGRGFFQRLRELPTGEWSGPVDSSFGVHLIRIRDKQAAVTPPLQQVQEALLRDWKATKAIEIREQYYKRLRERYVVEIIEPDTLTVENH